MSCSIISSVLHAFHWVLCIVHGCALTVCFGCANLNPRSLYSAGRYSYGPRSAASTSPPGTDKSARSDCSRTETRRSGDSGSTNVTANFSRALQMDFNQSTRLASWSPAFFHNFTVYHSHIIDKAFEKFNGSKISITRQAMEKYLKEHWDRYLVFIDSQQFMNGSLCTLAKYMLKSGPVNFKYFTAQECTRRCCERAFSTAITSTPGLVSPRLPSPTETPSTRTKRTQTCARPTSSSRCSLWKSRMTNAGRLSGPLAKGVWAHLGRTALFSIYIMDVPMYTCYIKTINKNCYSSLSDRSATTTTRWTRFNT